MALALKKAGFATVYCTPHLIKGCFEADNQAVKSSVSVLQRRLDAENVDLELLPGREYYLDEFLFDYLKDPLPLGETTLIMVEIPGHISAEFVKEACFRIKCSGYIPMIAHPERCALFSISGIQTHTWYSKFKPQNSTPSTITYLQEIGCAFQANLGSFSARYGPRVRQTATWLKRNEVYTHFGTDLHTLEDTKKATKTMAGGLL